MAENIDGRGRRRRSNTTHARPNPPMRSVQGADKRGRRREEGTDGRPGRSSRWRASRRRPSPSARRTCCLHHRTRDQTRPRLLRKPPCESRRAQASPGRGQRYIRRPPTRRRCANHLAFCTLPSLPSRSRLAPPRPRSLGRRVYVRTASGEGKRKRERENKRKESCGSCLALG